jgi:predicted CXXCH cytochrome family protein
MNRLSISVRLANVLKRIAGTRGKFLWASVGSAAVAVVFLSCSTLTRTVVVPPSIPGAKFSGSESCAQCHETITRDFKTADHARLLAKGAHSENIGCESCHGPGSIHISSGGAAHSIVNPRKSPETCFQCHLDVRAKFNLPNHHPVLEGKVSCGDCHNPHKGSAVKGGGMNTKGMNETCFQCHTRQKGPFVFEHHALREGCTTCHEPHGSVNARMLSSRNQTLCIKCHFQQQTTSGQLLIGGRDHTSFVTRGTCWSAGCHEATHGSQVSSSLRF